MDSSMGLNLEQVSLTKSTDMLAHYSSMVAFRESTLLCGLLQAFLSKAPQTSKSRGERLGEDRGHMLHGQKVWKFSLHHSWVFLAL